jgi:hypothetical protein
MNKFLKGVITGAAGMLVLVVLVLVFRFFQERDRKIYEYMEAQHEIELLQEGLAIVLLMSFWKNPVYGEPPTAQTRNSDGSGTKRYSEYEVDCLAKLDLLIEDLARAAHEAIEQAASPAQAGS